MRLIQRIEINYFRSLYTANFNRVGDLNVVFGRNDSGKSNFLRALNLFFNDEIEPDQELDFNLDISDARKVAARQAKGRQFIWIKITFKVPENYSSVLGEEVTVKRQWNRDGEMNETVFPHLATSAQRARLTRFLNDIDFTYIPAIKDLEVFADLIERMYEAAAESVAIQGATQRFVDAIGKRTRPLSEQLSEMFEGPARLAAPAHMASLFRNLDFSHGDDNHSLLRQKGDGIKARHIPEMLRFINDIEARPKLYLWGFEEPENSLDLKSAEIEADRFASFSSRDDTQVFITSHSPAFYLAENENAEVQRYFIAKQTVTDGNADPNNAASEIGSIEQAEAKMENAGLLQLPFLIRRSKQFQDQLAQFKDQAETLRDFVADLERPALLVEGKHDISMFEDAITELVDDNNIEIRDLGGAPENVDGIIAAVMQCGGLQPNQRTYFLFDNDKPGRTAFSRLSNHQHPHQQKEFGEGKFARCLPMTDEFILFLDRYGIRRNQAFFTAEFLYNAEESADLCSELIAGREGEEEIDDWLHNVNGQYFGAIGQRPYQRLLTADRGTPDWLFARGIPGPIKQAFSEQAVERGITSPLIDEITLAIAQALLPENI
ncbi:hypothetical protein TMRH483_01444 [Qipengyuania sp. 483]